CISDSYNHRVTENTEVAQRNHSPQPRRIKYPGAEMRHEPVPESFTRNAVNRPDQTAISFGGSSLSYSELLTRANQVANLLLSAGAGRCWPVAILCSLPPDIIAAIIGVLKAGCAFVPVDTQLPANKLAAMFAVVEPPLIIADGAHLELAGRLGQATGSRLIRFEDH